MEETTTTEIAQASPAPLSRLDDVVRKAADYAAHSKAENTIRSYRNGWERFKSWCSARKLPAYPASPETVALYIADLASTSKVATIQHRLVAISRAHQLQGAASPTKDARVREVLKGISREKGSAPKQKSPVGTAELRAMLAQTPKSLTGTRDRAVLLLGFAGAFRRSEIVALTFGDVQEVLEQGVILTLRRSKTDAEGKGRQVAIPFGRYPETCPCLALRFWREQSRLSDGSLFRPINRHGQILPVGLSDKSVALIVKRYAEAAGFDPSLFSGHSLRAGFCTAAAAKDVPEFLIMRQTGHRSERVLRQYIRAGSLFSQNPVSALEL